jgi:1-acyl-sn-glycerol-3-phosphate acyltransferase
MNSEIDNFNKGTKFLRHAFLIQLMVYPIGKIIAGPIYMLWLRKIEGLENIPRDKPFIMALNHISYYETVIMYAILLPMLNKQIYSLVNRRYWDSFFFRFVMNWGKCIPVYVDREEGAAQKNGLALQRANGFLKQGDLVQIFPEGSRSADGKLKKAYTGVARLALKANVPVIPIGVIGADKVWPRGKTFPRFKRCTIRIGKPLYFDRYRGSQPTQKMLNQITRRIMQEIGRLIGQEYSY